MPDHITAGFDTIAKTQQTLSLPEAVGSAIGMKRK
jgi:hypothetical protein